MCANVHHASSLCSVQRLLWEAISERLKDAERDEVKRAIGILLVEENQGLFAEAAALADILGDVQLNTSALLHRKQLCSNPERSMVEADILLVMDRLRSMVTTAIFANSSAKDRNPDSIVPKADAQDKAVYEYMQASTAIQAAGERPGTPLLRPSTASSRPPTASTMSRPSTASSSTSTGAVLDPMQLIACVQGKLSVFGIDDVKDAVRCALQEERTALLNDIEYLTALLTDEADMQQKVAAPPPSLQELKQYSSKLKSLIKVEQGRLDHELVVSKMFNAAQAEASKAGRLRRMVGASRDPQPAASQTLYPPPVPGQRGLDRMPSRSSQTLAGPMAALPPLQQTVPLQAPSGIAFGSQCQVDAELASGTSSPVSCSSVSVSTGSHRHLSQPQPGTVTPQGADELKPSLLLRNSGAGSPAQATVSPSQPTVSPSQTTVSHNQAATLHPDPDRPRPAPVPEALLLPAPAAGAMQRSTSGRRQVIQALRASSASSASSPGSSVQEHARAVEASLSMVQAGWAAQGGETHSVSPAQQPHHKTAPYKRTSMTKHVAGDLLEAHAETLKGGVAAILAKHNYSKPGRLASEPG